MLSSALARFRFERPKIEGAGNLGQTNIADTRINLRSLNPFVIEQKLNVLDVRSCFEQMSRKGVTKTMNTHVFFNLCFFFRKFENSFGGTNVQMFRRILIRKKPIFIRGRSAKLFPKNVARLREHRETIFLTLTYVVLEFSNF